MRACVQRVSRARVSVGGEVSGRIGRGLLVLLGVGKEDTPAEATMLAKKIAGLRVFEGRRGEDEPGACRRRRGDARGQSVHALGRLPQGPASQLRRRGAARDGRSPL